MELREEQRWLEWAKGQFRSTAGKDDVITEEDFTKALDVKRSFLASRFFVLLDKDKNGTIDFNELMEGLVLLCKGSEEERLKFLFQVYDINESGALDHDELAKAFRICVDENGLFINDEEIENLTELLVEEIDADGNGMVTFDELLSTLKSKYPDVLANLSLSVSKWLKPPVPPKKQSSFKCLSISNPMRSIRNNASLIITISVYFIVNVGLFTLSAVRYRHHNGFLIVARGCGMALNMNCALVVVFVLRNSLSWLRSSRLGGFFPCDHNIRLHKLVGRMIAILAIVHTVGHIGNIGFVVDKLDKSDNATQTTPMDMHQKTKEYFLFLFYMKSGIGWVTPGLAFPTGWALNLVLLVIVVCSMSFVRRRGNFQVFYWSHMLYIVFWTLLILHGSIFWYFFIVPGIIFLCENLYDSPLARLAKYGRTYVVAAQLLPSKVTHLKIRRPCQFDYNPGDYVYVKIPDIAPREWHPFTISSAPENKDVIGLHIRSAGNWTSKLYKYLKDQGKTLQQCYANDIESGMGSGEESAEGVDSRQVTLEATTQPASTRQKTKRLSNKRSYYRKKDSVANFDAIKIGVEIRGPYGTPSSDIFDTEHAVLIASGIGVTPFASILQSIMLRHMAAKTTCPKCSHEIYNDIKGTRLMKVDFVWINRDQQCFEWFLELLASLERRLAQAGMEDRLSIHLYLTGLSSGDNIKGMWLQLALDSLHDRQQRDAITGLKTRTSPGRPEWNKLFEQIDMDKKGKVKVFFCGSPSLAGTLNQSCKLFDFDFAKENF